jgi:hypothetical protein
MPAILVLYLAILAFLVPGWIMNLVAVISHFETMALGELLVRLAGLPIAVLGAFMGWFF